MNPGILKQQVLTCPACKKPIDGRFSYSLEFGEAVPSMAAAGASTVAANVTVTGMEIAHNCIPQATR